MRGNDRNDAGLRHRVFALVRREFCRLVPREGKAAFEMVAAAFAVWTLAGTLVPAASAAPISADRLYREDDVSQVAMSPDGLRVAAIRNGREDSVVIVDLASGEVTGEYGFGHFPARTLDWASNERLLIGFDIVEERRGELYVNSRRMVTVSVETGEMAVMFEDETGALRRNRWLGRVANMLPDDPAHILMPAFDRGGNHLWRVNIETGAAEIVERGRDRTFAWFTDRSGAAVMRVDLSSTYRRLRFYAPNAEGTWRYVRQARVDREDENQSEFWPVAPAAEDNQFFVIAHPDDEEYATIKLYDFERNELLDTVFAREGADVEEGLLAADTGELIGATVLRDRVETRLFDADAQRHIDGLEAFFGDRSNVRIWDGSRDGRFALLHVSSPSNPGEYWSYDFEAAQATYLFERKEGFKESFMGRTEVMSYEARDGTPLSAYLTHPPFTEPGEEAPLVVLVHGGPEARDRYDFDPQVQFLATRGYRVLQPYFRGSSGRGRSFAEAGYGQWGGLMQDDVTDAVRHLHAADMARPERTCIVGASYGGYAALYGGATTPELYACVASLAGVTDLRDQLRFDRREHGRDSVVWDYVRRGIGDPDDDRDKLEATSPVTHAGTFRLPVHLAHGEKDRIVPVQQSREMEKALRRAGRHVEYVEYEDERHSFRRWDTDRAYMNSLAAFLADHIGGRP